MNSTKCHYTGSMISVILKIVAFHLGISSSSKLLDGFSIFTSNLFFVKAFL